MKIVQLGPPAPPVAYDSPLDWSWLIARISEGLASRGHEVELFADARSKVRGVTVSSAGLEPPRRMDFYSNGAHVLRALRAINDCRPDAVLNHDVFLTPFLSRSVRVPMLTTISVPITRQINSMVVSADAARFVVLCTQQASLFQGAPAPNVIRPGVAKVSPRRKRGEHLAFVGRITHADGADLALRVASLTGRPLVMLVPYVDPQDPFYQLMARSQMRCADVSVVVRPPLSDRRDVIGSAHALLHTGRWPDPIARGPLEALASGTPTITSSVGGVSEVIRNGITGFVRSDVGEMADAVARTSTISPSDCMRHAQEKFDVERMIDNYERAYSRAEPKSQLRRRRTTQKKSNDRLRIALVAPPWYPVPPPKYGGTERIVYLLEKGLTERGHDVTLFASGDSQPSCRLVSVMRRHLGTSRDLWPLAFRHADEVFRMTSGFDIVHSHATEALALSALDETCLLHTIHAFDRPEDRSFYSFFQGKQLAVLSESQARLLAHPEPVHVVHNAVDTSVFQVGPVKGDYLLHMGRISWAKGSDLAVEVAIRSRSRLILAGKIEDEEFFRTEILPHIDHERIKWIGTVGGARKLALLQGARGLLCPLRWEEPFGLVLLEAMACGVPVLAFPRGAVAEIVVHGRTGLLAQNVEEMSESVGDLSRIDPAACRAHVVDSFSAGKMVSEYEAIYRTLIEGRTGEGNLITSNTAVPHEHCSIKGNYVC